MKLEFNFREIAEQWKNQKKDLVKRSTIAAYTLILEKHLLTYFETKNPNQETVQEFVDSKIKDGLSKKSVKDILVVLKMILKYAANLGYNVTGEFKIYFPKEYENKEIQVFSPNEQKILRDFLISHFSFKNIGILICLNTGMRIGEICALKWGDINLKKGIVLVSKTLYRIYEKKTDDPNTQLVIASPKTQHSYRSIPLSDSLKTTLQNMKSMTRNDFFVLTNTPEPIEPRTYRNYYKKLLQKLNLPELTFHGLRHTFATRCIESGCDYKTVSAILGHSDITTTLNLYVHPTQDQKKRCIEKMLDSLLSDS